MSSPVLQVVSHDTSHVMFLPCWWRAMVSWIIRME